MPLPDSANDKPEQRDKPKLGSKRRGGKPVGKPPQMKINDGTYDYILVSPEKQVSEDPPLTEVALYERIPQDPDYQYSPSLAYLEGVSTDPGMFPVER
jgi:hypothetical protein